MAADVTGEAKSIGMQKTIEVSEMRIFELPDLKISPEHMNAEAIIPFGKVHQFLFPGQPFRRIGLCSDGIEPADYSIYGISEAIGPWS